MKNYYAEITETISRRLVFRAMDIDCACHIIENLHHTEQIILEAKVSV